MILYKSDIEILNVKISYYTVCPLKRCFKYLFQERSRTATFLKHVFQTISAVHRHVLTKKFKKIINLQPILV